MNKYTLCTLLFLLLFQHAAFSEKSCVDTLFTFKNKRYYREDLSKLNQELNTINKKIVELCLVELEKDCFFKQTKKNIKVKRKLYKQFNNENDIATTLNSVKPNLVNECLLFGRYSETMVKDDPKKLKFKFKVYDMFDSYISKFYDSLDDVLYTKITSKDSEHLNSLYQYEDTKLDIQIRITKYWQIIDSNRYFSNVYYYVMNSDIYFDALSRLLPKLIRTKNHLRTLFDPNDPLMIKIDKEIEYICGSKECPSKD